MEIPVLGDGGADDVEFEGVDPHATTISGTDGDRVCPLLGRGTREGACRIVVGVIVEPDVVQPSGASDVEGIDLLDRITRSELLEIAVEIPGDGVPFSILLVLAYRVTDASWSMQNCVRREIDHKEIIAFLGHDSDHNAKIFTEFHIPSDNMPCIVPIFVGVRPQAVATADATAVEVNDPAVLVSVVYICNCTFCFCIGYPPFGIFILGIFIYLVIWRI